MSARTEFEEKLAVVNARAKALKELCDLKPQTGFTPNTTLLHDFASKLAWSCNYLSVAALKLVGASVGAIYEDEELLPGSHG